MHDPAQGPVRLSGIAERVGELIDLRVHGSPAVDGRFQNPHVEKAPHFGV